jgi:hypothetical protein
MTPIDCPRESEIVDAIAAGDWPHAAPVDLREHAATCPVCADLALAASALHDEAASTPATMALPSAGQVWWRAELRARHEAAQLAQRPMIAVHVVAAVVCIAAALTGLRSFGPDLWAWFVGVASSATRSATFDTWTLGLVLSIGLWVVLAPVAIYMVFRDDGRDDAKRPF